MNEKWLAAFPKEVEPTYAEILAFLPEPEYLIRITKQLTEHYEPKQVISYSGEKGYDGWNLKFRKYGGNILTVYIRDTYITVLIVVNEQDDDLVVPMMQVMSAEFQKQYQAVKPFRGSRWIMLDVVTEPVVEDVIFLAEVRTKRLRGKKMT